ncbi:MAG: hypothetical protein KIT72_07490 [Polyangiaceae bacterium]|nr:hypothetical protein [Polyangiaceae bacterium]
MTPSPKAEHLSIVVLGQFKPATVAPAWLEREGLVSKGSAAAAELQLMAPDVSSFTIASKDVQVLRERLTVSTGDAREEDTLSDLIVGILDLSHPPTTKLGLNYNGRFLLSSESVWHGKGHQLAPKEPWSGLLTKPGLLNVTMRDDCRPNGHLNVSVGPSPVKNSIVVTTNDHFEIPSGAARDAIALIKSEWRKSLSNARRIASILATESPS